MKKIISKSLAFALTLALLFAIVPFSNVRVSAAAYNGTAAAEYALAHVYDGVGECAEFVSNCLSAGGCGAWSKGVINLRSALINGGYGTEYSLATNGYRVFASDNSGKISLGDPIFFYCSSCGWTHVMICSAIENNIVKASGHNAAEYNSEWVNGYSDQYGHHGTPYVFHMTSHTHNYGAWQTVTAATCTTAGSSKQVCSCGDTKTRTDAALGHSWNNGEITQIAGCTDEGVKKYTCTRCSATRTEAISATGHTPVTDAGIPATCTESGLTEGSHCSKCGAVISERQQVKPLGHDYRIISYEKQCDSVSALFKCTRCEKTETHEESVLISDWSEEKPNLTDESVIESKTQYSFSAKEEKISKETSIPGWEKYKTDYTEYGNWSNWGTNYIAKTDLREVESKTVYLWYSFICPNCGTHDPYQGACSNCSYMLTSDHWFQVWLNIPFNWGESIGNGKTKISEYNTLYSAIDHDPTTGYRYKTRSIINCYYYRWTDYSNWLDEEYTESETCHVKTRTVYRYNITPTGHDYTAVGTNPTCTAQGYTTHTCSICGDSYTDTYTDALGHNESEWIVDTEPQIGVAGSKHTECTVCHTVLQTEEIPPLDPVVIDENAPKVTVESKKAYTGKEFTLSVDLSNNPGLAYLRLKLNYDSSAFELVSTSNAQLLTGTYTTSKSISTKPYILQWMGAEDSGDNGELVTLTFSVKDDATDGDYTVSIEVAEACNEEFEDVEVAALNGTVTVRSVIVGDLNGDGKINGKDGILCSQALAGWDVEYSELAADVNGDGKFNGKDGILLSQYLAGWDVVLG